MRRENYAYVQIIAYPSDPTMNGKMLPMRIPFELVKLFNSMARPSEQEVALELNQGRHSIYTVVKKLNVQLSVRLLVQF